MKVIFDLYYNFGEIENEKKLAEMTLKTRNNPPIKKSKSSIGSFTKNVPNDPRNVVQSAAKLDFESFTNMMPKNHQKGPFFRLFKIVDLGKF